MKPFSEAEKRRRTLLCSHCEAEWLPGFEQLLLRYRPQRRPEAPAAGAAKAAPPRVPEDDAAAGSAMNELSGELAAQRSGDGPQEARAA